MGALACVGLGSNVGDRRGQICAALTGMAGTAGVEVVRVSSLYETAPWGGVAQDPFLNAVALIQAELAPGALLDRLLALEQQLGRARQVRWGPRTIDLDLLLYDDVEMRTARLELPHPLLTQRAFVLVPLLEVMPEVRVGGVPCSEHLARLVPGEVAWWGEPPQARGGRFT